MTQTSSRRELARRTLEFAPLVMRVMSVEMRQVYAGMHPGHMAVMRILTYKPFTLGDLAEHMSVSPPTMSNTISALEERGWVERRRAKDDRRLVWIEITDAGRAMMDSVTENVEARMTSLLSALDDEQSENVEHCMTLLRDILAKALELDPDNCRDWHQK